MGERDFRVKNGLVVDGTGASSIAGSLGIGITPTTTLLEIGDGTDKVSIDPTFVRVFNDNGSGTNATVQMWAETWGGKVGTTSSDDFLLYAHNAERVKFDSVYKSTFFGSTFYKPIIRLTTKDTTVSDTDTLGEIQWTGDYDSDGGDTDSVAASISAVAEADFTATANTTALVFSTATSEAASEKMRLTNAGNLALNTTSPFTVGQTAKLTVSGGISWGVDNTDLSYFRRLSAGNFQWQTYNSGNTGNIHLQPYGGSVGIGTTAPAYQLEVEGSTNAYAQLTAGDNTSYSGLLFGDSDANAVGRIQYYHTDNRMTFYTNGSEQMRITSAGNVGIGTTDPKEILHAEGDIRADGTFLVEDQDADYYMIQLTNSAGSTDYEVGIN